MINDKTLNFIRFSSGFNNLTRPFAIKFSMKRVTSSFLSALMPVKRS